jgi:tetratricopeptide (TPR) repeat protein
MSDLYLQVQELCDRGDFDRAWGIVVKMLNEDPTNGRALVSAGHIACRTEHYPEAYHFCRSATQILPRNPAAWINFGHVCSLMSLHEESEKHYLTALKYCTLEADQKVMWINLAALYVDRGNFAKGEAMSRKILEVDPDNQSAKSNIGFCQLARRDWKGWANYHHTIGTDWRPKVQYADEPEWDGSPGKTVALYSDQGLGDEISFASIVPDAIDISAKVILDCDSRLTGLFRRSFPQAKVYGTRGMSGAKWAKEDWKIDASLPLGQIGEFFRTTDESFPRTPYLIPCPDRRRMWKSLFMAKHKPVIGIAWTGGVPKNNSRNRKLTLEDFLPIFKAIDAHYVSLQYKDASAEIAEFRKKHEVDLKQYAYGTLTKDYDDTAALIAACDYVLCIQTAVAHTAGALGTPVTVLLPVATQWRYGTAHESIPWYDCLRVIRQQKSGSWRHEIERAANELATYFARVPGGTGETAPGQRALRDGVGPLRSARVEHHQPNGSDPHP